ncbi:MAG: protein kinase [Magnetococcales bacterium]|nr:protein kinase [Magnetococcales bacterium]
MCSNLISDLPKDISFHLCDHFASIAVDRVSNKGANGYLVFGKNKISNQKVAIKYYYWGENAGLHFEPKRLAEIQHDNVIRINDAGYVNNSYSYFMTPFFERGDLDDLINAGCISLFDAIKLTFEISCGLSQIHASKMVHRDLKPENILVNDVGKAVIADFGSVKMLPDGMETVPGSGHSIAYRPPESFEGSYGKQGDVYQVGIILYQLLGGRFQYNPEKILSEKENIKYETIQSDCEKSLYVDNIVKNKIIKGALIKLDTLPVWVPENIKRIIKKVTNINPWNRTRSASELVSILHAHQLNVPRWIDNGSEIQVEHKGKCLRVCQDAKGMWFAEKKVPSGWQKNRAIKVDLKENVIKDIKIKLNII